MKNIIEGTVTNYTIEGIINEISDAALNKKNNSSVPSTILQNLDEILKNIVINSTDNRVFATSKKLVVGVIDTEKNTSICGLKVDIKKKKEANVQIDLMHTSVHFLERG